MTLFLGLAIRAGLFSANIKHTRIRDDSLTTTVSDPAIQRLQSDAEITKQALQESRTQISNQTSRISALEAINANLERQNDVLRSAHTNTTSSIWYTESVRRKLRVDKAIADLQLLLSTTSGNRPTKADKAILGIIDCLTTGLSGVENRQAYFNHHRKTLQNHVRTLQYAPPSILNSLLNLIVTVLALCSIIGFFILWATGVLKANQDKNGSIFAFTVFGSKQKAEREIAIIAQASGIDIMQKW